MEIVVANRRVSQMVHTKAKDAKESPRLWIGLFLSSLESTIVSTSLVSITNALNGFIMRDWIVTAYLLSYTSKQCELSVKT
jgi:MFS family permease